MSKRTRNAVICAGLCAGVMAGSAFGAPVISLNISSGAAGTVLAPTDVVGTIPVANWNNLPTGTGSGRTLLDLTDNTGATTNADIVVGGVPNAYTNNTTGLLAPMDDDMIMMRTTLGSSQNGEDRTITGTNIPYAAYDIYVYFGGVHADATVPYVINASLLLHDGVGYNTQVGDTLYMRDTNRTWDGTYNESTATTAAAAVDGNEYVVFRNVTTSSFRIHAESIARRSGFSGIQIVAVPEPAGLALVGGMGLLALRRRRA